MKRIGTSRRKTRNIFKKPQDAKGKISIAKYLQEFNVGDRVLLKAESAVQTGQYFRRFHGRTGLISGKQGECYKVDIKDINKPKSLIVHPVHLRKVN